RRKANQLQAKANQLKSRAASCENIANQLREHSLQLKSRVDPILQQWTGEGARSLGIRIEEQRTNIAIAQNELILAAKALRENAARLENEAERARHEANLREIDDRQPLRGPF